MRSQTIREESQNRASQQGKNFHLHGLMGMKLKKGQPDRLGTEPDMPHTVSVAQNKDEADREQDARPAPHSLVEGGLPADGRVAVVALAHSAHLLDPPDQRLRHCVGLRGPGGGLQRRHLALRGRRRRG